MSGHNEPGDGQNAPQSAASGESPTRRVGTCYVDPVTGEYVMPGDFAGEPEFRWRPEDSSDGRSSGAEDNLDVNKSYHSSEQVGQILSTCPASGASSCYACAKPGCAEGEPNELLASIDRTFRRCLGLAARKNADYTGGADPFANFDRAALVGVDPLRGLLVRMLDKVSRAAALIDKDPAVAGESLGDTFDDLTNYSAIGRAMVDRRP